MTKRGSRRWFCDGVARTAVVFILAISLLGIVQISDALSAPGPGYAPRISELTPGTSLGQTSSPSFSPVGTNSIPKGAHHEGVVPRTAQVSFEVGLASLNSFKPSSPEAYRTDVGGDAVDAQPVLDYLNGFGIKVTQPTGPYLYGLTGSAGSVDVALQISLTSFAYGGHLVLAPGTIPKLPSSISPYVQSFIGLNEFSIQAPILPWTQPLLRPGHLAAELSSTIAAPIAPSTMQSFYNELTTINSGIQGKYAIGLTEVCDPNEALSQYQTDLNEFDSNYSLARTTIRIETTGGTACNLPSSGNESNWRVETSLDIQWAHAMAPGATLYVCIDYGNNTSPAYPINCVQWFNQNLAATGVKFISNSWDYFSNDALWQALAKQGVTVLSAAGDNGGGANPPATEPWGLAVGGTQINSDGSEVAWPGSSGGCATNRYIAPPWQWNLWNTSLYGTGYPCQSTNWPILPSYRGVPDVAADAGTLVNVWVNNQVSDSGGGTSLSTPLWTGMLDVIVQASGLPPQFETPLLYYLATSGQRNSVFHDITSGCNKAYCAVTGWDAVTGLGSPNVANMASWFSKNPLPYWLGSEMTYNASPATSLSVDLTVPNANPTSAQYAVFLGAFDNAFSGSWDSIGLSSYNGEWNIFYESETDCNPATLTGVTNWSGGLQLTNGYGYNFKMRIQSGGLSFSAAFASSPGTTIWSKSYTTKATGFLLGNTNPCDPLGQPAVAHDWFPGWTDGEYFPNQFEPIPPFEFYFTDNQQCYSGGSCDSYSGLKSFYSNASPSGYPFASAGAGTWVPYVTIQQTSSPVAVTVENEIFASSISSNTLTITRGYSGSVSGSISCVDPSCSAASDSTSLSLYSATPYGFSFTWNPQQGAIAPLSFTLTISANTSAICTLDYVGIRASSSSMSPTESSEVGLTVDVVGCGGGGCVAAGSPILTAKSGYVSVQKLKVGQTVVGYDFSLAKLVNETLLGNNETEVSSIVSINQGWLRVTSTDQPIYVLNGTWAGWVHDPLSLFVGEEIFDPISVSWTEITNIAVLNGKFAVYDVVTSGPNDFVDSGGLLDRKCCALLNSSTLAAPIVTKVSGDFSVAPPAGYLSTGYAPTTTPPRPQDAPRFMQTALVAKRVD